MRVRLREGKARQGQGRQIDRTMKGKIKEASCVGSLTIADILQSVTNSHRRCHGYLQPSRRLPIVRQWSDDGQDKTKHKTQDNTQDKTKTRQDNPRQNKTCQEAEIRFCLLLSALRSSLSSFQNEHTWSVCSVRNERKKRPKTQKEKRRRSDKKVCLDKTRQKKTPTQER